jgi:long-subunit acyl-CoA synthetase (AMP-forming)
VCLSATSSFQIAIVQAFLPLHNIAGQYSCLCFLPLAYVVTRAMSQSVVVLQQCFVYKGQAFPYGVCVLFSPVLFPPAMKPALCTRFGSPVDEEIRKERQQAEYMARAAAWDAEKASARLVKVRCP